MSVRASLVTLERIYKTVLIILTIFMFITVTYNVFMRFVINQSVGWADELSRFIFIWISFLGAVLAYKKDEHVGLSFLVDKIRSPRVRRGIGILQQSLILGLLVLLTYFGYHSSTTVMNVSPALSIPMSWVYLIVPFCGFLMCMMAIYKLIALFRGADIDTNTMHSVE